ncbi:hypothetical protein [Kiloniella sp. b19]|uniref:hypothetical protein n=1 Tax=Kiloniella sp. GXU_MW_B19 TaxID=3141326 RepID=UPI0031E2AAF7
MRLLHPSSAVNRLAILIGAIAPLVFLGTLFLRSGAMPLGQDLLEYTGLAAAIGFGVWIVIHLCALLIDALSPLLNRFFRKLAELLGFLKAREKKEAGDKGLRSNKAPAKTSGSDSDDLANANTRDASVKALSAQDHSATNRTTENTLHTDLSTQADNPDDHLAEPEWARRDETGKSARQSSQLKGTPRKSKGTPESRTFLILLGAGAFLIMIDMIMSSFLAYLLFGLVGFITIVLLWFIWSPEDDDETEQ